MTSLPDSAAMHKRCSALEQPGAAQRRVERMRLACAEISLDSFYVRNTSNIAWLTAFDGVFDDEDAHALLITPDEVFLHTDSRYAEAAGSAASAEKTVSISTERLPHAAFVVHQLVEAGVVSASEDSVSGVLGIEDSITLADFRALEKSGGESNVQLPLKETSSFVKRLRAVKEPSEIARMRAAQKITDAAFTHIVSYVRPGMTEQEVQRELESFMLSQGAESLAFPSIVAAGVNGASPHAIPGKMKLEAGQCLVLDFGARMYGYCSDMTRMIFLGQPDALLCDAYATIRQANEQVQKALRPGVSGAAMHQLAENVLEAGGFAGMMGHALGHGVGLDIHEQPSLSPHNTEALVEGNVITVEPGIYIPNKFGMRLEDFGVITRDGFAVFTQSTHEMVII